MSEHFPPVIADKTRFLLVRHGQTRWNVDGRYQGQSDTALSSLGHAQAEALTVRLGDCGAHALVSSPLLRARDTALSISRHLGLEMFIDDRLGEIAYGIWEGLTQAQVKARWPEALRSWKSSPDTHPPTGGEPLPMAAERVRHCLDELATSHASPIIVVTHAGVIRLALIMSTHGKLAAFREVKVDNAEVIVLDWPTPSSP